MSSTYTSSLAQGLVPPRGYGKASLAGSHRARPCRVRAALLPRPRAANRAKRSARAHSIVPRDTVIVFRDKIDPLVIVFSEIKRCQNPQFTQIVQKAKKCVCSRGATGASRYDQSASSSARDVQMSEDGGDAAGSMPAFIWPPVADESQCVTQHEQLTE